MKWRTPMVGVVAAALACALAGQTTTSTYTKKTTVQNPDGSSTVTISGEVIRYEPGQTIVVRQPDTTVVTYTLGPGITVPAEVQVGRRVTVYSDASDPNAVKVTRITSYTTGPPSGAPPQPLGTTYSRETTLQSPAATTRVTASTTVSGEVVRYAPGQTIVIRQPDRQEVTYSIRPGITVPVEVEIGRKVTLTTEPSSTGSGSALVTRVTTSTITPEGERKTTTEKTEMTSSGDVTKSKTTTVYGTVSAYEPGQTVTILRPDKTTVTYTIDETSQLPTNLVTGKQVTVQTTTVAESDSPVVRKVVYRTKKTKNTKKVSSE